MNNTANKKDIFYIIVLILTFITVIVGATFAIYVWVYPSVEEEGTSAVYTGTLSIEYLSGEIIRAGWLYPREKPTLEDTHNVYKNNFKVTNTGSLDSEIEVYVDINENTFKCPPTEPLCDDKKLLEYSLYDEEGVEVSNGFIEGNNSIKIASNIELTGYEINEENKSYETKSYTLLIWLKNDIDKEQNWAMKKTLTGQIRVEADMTKEFKK